MTKPLTENRKIQQKRSNTLTLLRDMPNTIGKLQWARDTFFELSQVCLSDIVTLDARFDLEPEVKEKEKIKAINRAKDAMRDMVQVCNVLLPYQSPKLTAVDIRRTNDKVVRIYEDYVTYMKKPAGTKVPPLPKALDEAQELADRDVDIDSINEEIEEGEYATVD